jgi:hypothetical protein
LGSLAMSLIESCWPGNTIFPSPKVNCIKDMSRRQLSHTVAPDQAYSQFSKTKQKALWFRSL